ncbi:hypothetical protein [Flavobacterium sp.]|uniref:hypothetical protein n=1 Tax=Flavobacterium sp. TaxID=239 RepID=UPI002487F964|nr:hypothetical protein [Flavobacterium sp.]MDI1317223.1 hypothetical protein [Flavobacterium sp.]
MWKNVEDQCKALYDYRFINANDPVDRRTLIRLIAEEFPNYSRMRISYAVDQCLKTNSETLRPTTFVSAVKTYLM